MSEASKVMLNKAKDLRAYCEAVGDCKVCPFRVDGGTFEGVMLVRACGLNFPSQWILGEGEDE